MATLSADADARPRRPEFALAGYNIRHALRAPPKSVFDSQPRSLQPGTSFVTDPGPELQPSSTIARRWTVIASGLLLLSLALVVIYTRPSAFRSPTALVVVAAIGVAALLLEVRFRRELPRIHPPLGLTILGIVCAIVSFFADFLRLARLAAEWTAFAAIICFGISGSLILHALGKLRRPRE